MSKKTIIPFFKGFLAFFLVALSFFHVFFDSKDYRVNEQLSLYRKKIKQRDSKLISHFDKNNDSLGKEMYLSYREELSAIKKARNKYAKEFSFQGRSSFHFWIFVFGLVTALSYFACKSLFDEISKGSTFKHHLVSLSGIVVACFWFTHLLFFTQNDFNKNVYFLTILGLAVLFSVFTYFLIKYYSYKDQIIYNLLGLVGRIKNKHYKRIATKAMYSEKNDSSVISTDTAKENINDFDKDVIETLKKM